MQARNLGEVFFHHPVDFRRRQASPDVAGDRQVVDHVAQRRGFDEQNAHGRRIIVGGLYTSRF
jgi:hypothetical protein